jgi:hypothetical protein
MKTTISLRLAGQILGITLGQISQLRARDCKQYDPAFPPMSGGTFDLDEIMAWRAARRGSHNPPTVTPAVAGGGILK